MSEEINARLKTTSEECLKCYEVWSSNDKDDKAREALQDAIHELRKVASRLEIELAISERDQMKQRPLPIPPHRDARVRGRNHDGDEDHATHENSAGNSSGNRSSGGRMSGGNAGGSSSASGVDVQRKPQRRRTAPKDKGGADAGGVDDNAGNGN